MKINTSRNSGFTLVEIMIVVAIIGLLAAIAIPNFVRARSKSQQNACINNLRQIDGAIQQYALETKLAASADVTSAQCAPYLGRGAGIFPTCPAQGTYAVTKCNVSPTCSLSTIAAPGAHILPTS